MNNLEQAGSGLCWTTGTTLFKSEVDVLKKLVPDVNGIKAALEECATVTQSQYETMLRKFSIEGNPAELGEVNSWILLCGPKIVEG